MIARGLATNARLLVLDEPTASLTRRGDQAPARRAAAAPRRRRGDRLRHASAAGGLRRHGRRRRHARRQDGLRVADGEGRAQPADRAHHRAAGRRSRPSAGARRRTETAREELLRVEGLGRPGVVEDASFVVRAGDVLGIAGLVGAGRTELVRLIFGADRADLRPGPRRGPAGAHPRPARRDGGPESCCCPRTGATRARCTRSRCARTSPLPTLRQFRRDRSLPLPSRARERRAVPRPDRPARRSRSPTPRARSGTSPEATSRRWCWRSGSSRAPSVLIFDEPTHGIDVGAKEEVYRLMVGPRRRGQGRRSSSRRSSPSSSASATACVVMREGRLVGEFEGLGDQRERARRELLRRVETASPTFRSPRRVRP